MSPLLLPGTSAPPALPYAGLMFRRQAANKPMFSQCPGMSVHVGLGCWGCRAQADSCKKGRRARAQTAVFPSCWTYLPPAKRQSSMQLPGPWIGRQSLQVQSQLLFGLLEPGSAAHREPGRQSGSMWVSQPHWLLGIMTWYLLWLFAGGMPVRS